MCQKNTGFLFVELWMYTNMIYIFVKLGSYNSRHLYVPIYIFGIFFLDFNIRFQFFFVLKKGLQKSGGTKRTFQSFLNIIVQ